MSTEPLVVKANPPAPKTQGPKRRRPPGKFRLFVADHRRAILGVGGIVIVLAAWEICARLHVVDPAFTSRPSQIAVTFHTYFTTGTGWEDVRVSGEEFGIGFGLAMGVGLIFGFLMGWWTWLDELTDPLVNWANAAPRVALIPLLVVWFGIGLSSKIAIVFLGAVIPIILSARSGVKVVDRSLLQVARSFNATEWQLIRTVVIPSSLPSVVTGIRLGVGRGLVGMVVGELFASTVGLGHTIQAANTFFRPDLTFVALFIVSGAGIILSSVVLALEKRLSRWRVQN